MSSSVSSNAPNSSLGAAKIETNQPNIYRICRTPFVIFLDISAKKKNFRDPFPNIVVAFFLKMDLPSLLSQFWSFLEQSVASGRFSNTHILFR